MRSRSTSFVALAMLLTALAAPAARANPGCAPASHPGGEWRTYGLDLDNTRNQTAETTISPENVDDLEAKWTLSVAGMGATGTIETVPIIADGCMYVTTQTGWIIAANADTGALVWKVNMGAPVTTVSVANGRVFGNVSPSSAPAVFALDQETGEQIWRTTISTQRGSDADGSVVAFGDLVASGISCQGSEGSSGANRFTCRGGLAILSQSDGELLSVAWTIDDDVFGVGNGGAAIWSVPAVDMETGYAYVGTGNPFGREHQRANAIVKVDVNESRSTFGTIVDAYKATPEQYLPFLGAQKPACAPSGYNFGLCELPDVDLAVSPTLYKNARGIKLVSAGQGSGIWHTARADTMEYEWSTLTGGPYAGHRGGGGAYDGEKLYMPGGNPGHLWSLEKNDGAPEWVSPTGAGNNSFTPLAHANGVVYTLGGTNRPPFLFGIASPPYLLALSAESGQPLFVRPLVVDTGDAGQGTVAGGPVVARNTVYAPVNGVTRGGFIVAYGLPPAA